MAIPPQDYSKNYKLIKHFVEPLRIFIREHIDIVGELDHSANRRKVNFLPKGTQELFKIEEAIKILDKGVKPDGVSKILNKTEIDQLRRKAVDAINAKGKKIT
jgi:hypothetical protein